jgi:hypothetical protein
MPVLTLVVFPRITFYFQLESLEGLYSCCGHFKADKTLAKRALFVSLGKSQPGPTRPNPFG